MSWATVAAAATAAGASYFGQQRANTENLKEAARNRSFQERMRNTQWQSAVADMEAAGINPALAYSEGPNAAPGGSTATVSDEMTGGVSSAMQALQLRKNLALLDSQIAETKQRERESVERTKKTRYEARISGHAADMDTARWNHYFTPEGDPKGALKELLDMEHSGRVANSAKSISQAELAKLSIPERQAIALVFDELGKTGKMSQIGYQMVMPMIIEIMRGTRGR